ncbi:MAG: 3-deoxy-7-phosphoheptulonate synthase [Chloroflexi bacterium]|nr:MAG: 3-deoxy-7-phosphoheptulonate synthase [Chloroflexota bacterium]MBL1193452.1 3-deoxy-7-phosphoheptulonate synthase [Chloroflexota bacterium]NOH10743.1 3-deoxy-7-phosphoheptulonate synthase [Chloroflexota bacterium]
MMIIMKVGATKDQINAVMSSVENLGLKAHPILGDEHTVIGVVGEVQSLPPDQFVRMPGVERSLPISKPYKLASLELHPKSTTVTAGPMQVGGEGIAVIAGPCSVESRDQLLETAQAVHAAGAHALRGGAFKPRTSPYTFQGMGEEGLEILAEAREITGLPIVTEVMEPDLVELVASYADVLQLGTRNMQNYALLRAAGESGKPVLLKRGMSASLKEFLLAAEYVLSTGNQNVILCERGIRTFETATRNTTDINAVPVLKAQTHLPVIVDPSHSTGDWNYVAAVSRAAIAAGADGLILEVHPNPLEAMSDGGQSLKPKRFVELMRQLDAIAKAVDRSMAPAPERVAVPAV